MKSKNCLLIVISLLSFLLTNCAEDPEVINAINPEISIFPDGELLSVEIGSSINFQIELEGKDATFNKLLVIQSNSSGSEINELENRDLTDPLFTPYYVEYEFFPKETQRNEIVELTFKFENSTETNSGALAISSGEKSIRIKIN